jgi:L-ribulose-5-phosphate 4-epimerase
MTRAEIAGAYEARTGDVIVRRFRRLDHEATRAVLVHRHGPFCWGQTAAAAVQTAVILEELAHMAWCTMALNPKAAALGAALHHRHFTRKHGPDAYYGQPAPRRGR